MRIIAGKYKGRRLFDFKGNDIRPTTDRIKETIFNIIQFEVPGSTVIDLFAGTGALGIECLSRGANEVHLIDNSSNSIELIKSNLNKIDGNIKVHKNDAVSFLNRRSEKADIFFVDPPYKSELGIESIKYIFNKDLLNYGGVIIHEHSADVDYAFLNNGYRVDKRQMGAVKVDFIYKRDVVMFAGSFDPVTVGHVAVVEKALEKYEEVLVAMLINVDKKYKFAKDIRLDMLKQTFKDYKRVEVVFSDQYAYEVARKYSITRFIRGIRNDEDLAYEDKISEFNAQYGIKTEYIKIDKYKDVSSTNVKNEIECGLFTNLPINAKLTLLKDSHGDNNGNI